MSNHVALNITLFIFRLGIGGVMVAHGVNHVVGGGKIEGTSRWFGSMGMKWPRAQAWLASVTEVGGGVLLIVGLFTPFGGAAVIGVMTVALVINHRGNGFFIFRPGEGWEYVMTLAICGLVMGVVGPGEWSVDDVIGLREDFVGSVGFLLSGLGLVGASALLAVTWRPIAGGGA